MTRAKHITSGSHNPNMRLQLLRSAESGNPITMAFGEYYKELPPAKQTVIENDLSVIIETYKNKNLGKKYNFGIVAAIEVLAIIVASEQGWLRSRISPPLAKGKGSGLVK